MRLSAADPSQQRLIRDKLQEAKDQLSMMRASGGTVEGKWSGTIGAACHPMQRAGDSVLYWAGWTLIPGSTYHPSDVLLHTPFPVSRGRG